LRSSSPLSPLAFPPISTHFTAPPAVPRAPNSLERRSTGSYSTVEPMGFHFQLTPPPTRPLSPVIPSNVRTVRLTAAAGTNLARASSWSLMICSQGIEVYNPKAFILHAASLRQGCPHCGRFSTAATRRCLASVSVPVVGIVLSHPLPVVALVSRYLAN
jgi:hypothetical protein